MSRFGTEAEELARWPLSQRATALKGIVPRVVVVKQVLRECGLRGWCPRVPGWLAVWIVIGLGLFCRDSCRQICRWLCPWSPRRGVPAGVIQELWGLMLSHYVLRSLMAEAARRASVAPVGLSFTATLKILQCRLPGWPATPSAQRRWWRDLIDEIAAERLEPRRNRVNPRVVRQQRSKWPRKRKKHQRWPQPRHEFRDCIVIRR